MLQQILRDMTIDPELLAELSEEQKLILFVKMREEQVRRYKEWAEETDKKKKSVKTKSAAKNRKRVDFMKGKDGNPWVWVMGDHPNDKSIEQILEEEAQAKALKQAEKEAEEIRKQEEEDLRRRMEEQRRRFYQEAEERRKKEEAAALYQSIKEARKAAEKLEKEKREREAEDKFEVSQDVLRRTSVAKMDQVKRRRSSEIYFQWKEMRRQLEIAALSSSVEVDQSWKEQEVKAKIAEKRRREMAQLARDEHKESLRRTNQLIQTARAFCRNHSTEKPPLPPKEHLVGPNNTIKLPATNRPLRPPNRAAVVKWFQEEEKPRGPHLNQAGQIAPWFHGIISRGDAEKLLENKGIGTFLVRVSERVWGYTISYKGADRIKHFLVDTSDTGYQFFGADQLVHRTLGDLVKFHQDTPLAIRGDEKLDFPCRQECEPPDYWELLHEAKTEHSVL